MDLQTQVKELREVIVDIKEAVFAETAEIAAKIVELEEKLKEFTDIDLSEDIASLKASVEAIQAISGDEEEEVPTEDVPVG